MSKPIYRIGNGGQTANSADDAIALAQKMVNQNIALLVTPAVGPIRSYWRECWNANSTLPLHMAWGE